MPSCALRTCKNRSGYIQKDSGVTYHGFPTDPYIKNKWIEATGRKIWFPTKSSRICSIHFHEDDFTGPSKYRRVISTAYPTIGVLMMSNDGKANEKQSQAGPSRFPCIKISDVDAFNTALQDSLISGKTEQCRFCGEFGKTCVPVYQTPYLFKNKITLAVNENIVQLDFEEDSLPQTVCRECDAKLKEMYDFVQVIKAAQINLIKVGALDIKEDNIENEDTEDSETVVVKTEYDDDSGGNSDAVSENENKDRILDSETIVETEFIESIPQKRKGNTGDVTAKKPKKAEVTKIKRENKYSELYIEVKEELIEREETNEDETKRGCLYIEIKEELIEREETNEDVTKTGCSINDTGTDVRPNEVELATNALIYEMKSDRNDGVI